MRGKESRTKKGKKKQIGFEFKFSAEERGGKGASVKKVKAESLGNGQKV